MDIAEDILPIYEVFVDGSNIPPETHLDIYGIEVDQDIETVGMFSLLMNAGELDVDSYKWIDSELFRPGSEVKIRMGYSGSLETMIVGEITSLAPEYPEPGAIAFKIQGYDKLYRLGCGRKTRSFRNMKDSEIAVQIAQDWKLTPEVDATDITHEYVLQDNKTDREFLSRRARRIRYEISSENKSLYFQKPKEDKKNTITLTYGDNLIDFYPRLSTIRQTGKVVVRGWSPQEKKEILGEAGIGDETSKMGGKETGGESAGRIAPKAEWFLCEEALATKEDAEGIARAKFNEMALEFITGEGSCIGNPKLKAGEVVELKRLGNRFSGLYYMVSCKHIVGENGYTTYFKVKRSAV